MSIRNDIYKHTLIICRKKRNDELLHYGVKGMKWGVRRYQNKDGTLTAKGKERYRNTKTGMSAYAGMLDRNIRYPQGYKMDSFKESLVDPDNPNRVIWPENEKIRETRYRQDYMDDPDTAFDKAMAKINTTNGVEPGTINNCTKVSTAMIMAKKGYDYDAGRCHGGDANAFDYWFDNVEKTVCDNLSDAISTKLNDCANGSYGTVNLRNHNGGGHVFNWEKNSRGEFNLYEGQTATSEKFSGSSVTECFDKYIEKRPWFDRNQTVRVHDMTDATPNWDHMAEDSVLRVTDAGYTNYMYDVHTNKVYNDL